MKLLIVSIFFEHFPFQHNKQQTKKKFTGKPHCMLLAFYIFYPYFLYLKKKQTLYIYFEL